MRNSRSLVENLGEELGSTFILAAAENGFSLVVDDSSNSLLANSFYLPRPSSKNGDFDQSKFGGDK